MQTTRFRKTLWRRLALIGLLAWHAQYLGATYEPTDTDIRFVGRWDKQDAHAYHSYWGGAYLEVRFTGTTAKVILGKATSLLVNFDHTCDRILNNVNGVVDLTPIPLPPGAHFLRLAAYFDEKEILFKGLILDEGAVTLPPMETKREIIEFIGDSVTSGADCPYGDGDSYAWHTARLLGMDHTQISDPGIALVDGVNAIAGMERAYLRLKTPNYTSDNPEWTFAYVPDAVVINLGSNDYYSKCPPEKFQNHYVKFLGVLRARYPQAKIFALRLFHGWYETAVRDAVAARNAAGDPNVHFVDTTGWLAGYGEPASSDFVQKSRPSVHPSQTGHVKVARHLSEMLRTYLTSP